MYMLPLIDCAELLNISTARLTIWIKDVEMKPYDHPTNVRSKCLTMEQIQQLADLHQRENIRLDVLFRRPLFEVKDVEESQQESMSSALREEAVLRKKLTNLEMNLVRLQEQVGQLTLILLKEPSQREEQYQQLVESLITSLEQGSQLLKERHIYPVEQQARKRGIAQIVYNEGSMNYIIISPEEGHFVITPDTPEWFEMLASLSSFRFVGRQGRFTAKRLKSNNGKFTRSWSAQRTFNKKGGRKYLGMTEKLTIEYLENAASSIASRLKESDEA